MRYPIRLAGAALLAVSGSLACSEDDATPDASGGAGGSAGSPAGAGTSTGGSKASGGTAAVAGSGGSPAQAGAAGAAVTDLRGPCADGTRLGGFEAMLEQDYTSIRGKVLNAVVSSAILTELASDSGCKLVKAENPYCSGGCDSGQVCSSDAKCVAAAVSQSVGNVAISGLAAAATMKPVVPGNNYFVSGDIEFPHPGFEPGSATALTATGGDLPGFSLYGKGVAALALAQGDWILERTKPFLVTWTKGGVEEASLRITLRVDQHGTSPVTLTCVTDDDGELEVSATLVDALLDAGVTGFPTGQVYRETVDSVELGAGCVELAMAAHQQRTLRVAGYVPCRKQQDCPDGKTCNLPLERCE